MGDTPPEGRRGPQLLDVLRVTPVPGRAIFWSDLPSDAQASFRLISKEGQRLSHLLQSSFTLGQSGFALTQQQRDCQGAYLARCEHLEMLVFHRVRNDEHMVQLLQVGRTACRNVREVHMTDSQLWEGNKAGSALVAACPLLTSLHLVATGLRPAQYNALGQLQHLTEVHLTRVVVSRDLAAALSSLGSLRKLSIITMESIHFQHASVLPRLAVLTGLRDLRLSCNYAVEKDVQQLTCLSCLVQLTRLVLSPPDDSCSDDLRHDTGWHGAVNAVLAQMVPLQSLVSLDITGMDACVGGTGLAALCELPCLVRLHVNDVSTYYGTPQGDLRQLQDFRLAWQQDSAGLKNGLELVRPLSELVTLRVNLSLKDTSDRVAAAIELSARLVERGYQRTSAAGLAHAVVPDVFRSFTSPPHLRHMDMTLVCGTRYQDVEFLNRADLRRVLRALPPSVDRLTLEGCTAAQLSGLSTTLAKCARVTSLHLVDCHVDDDALIGLALHADQLRCLRVGECYGATAVLAQAFVSARVRPLNLSWVDLTKAEVGTIGAYLRAVGERAGVCMVPYDEQ